MSNYNYPETKKKLMDLQLEDPNPLPIHFIIGFKNWMRTKYNLILDDKEVVEIKAYMESAKIVNIGVSERGSRDLEFTMRNGKVERFNKSASDFIRAMQDFTPELKIKISEISEADMEQEIKEKRIDLAKDFAEIFKSENFRYKDSGESVDWVAEFENGYEYYELSKPITPKQIVANIKSGKMSLAVGTNIMSLMETVTYPTE